MPGQTLFRVTLLIFICFSTTILFCSEQGSLTGILSYGWGKNNLRPDLNYTRNLEFSLYYKNYLLTFQGMKNHNGKIEDRMVDNQEILSMLAGRILFKTKIGIYSALQAGIGWVDELNYIITGGINGSTSEKLKFMIYPLQFSLVQIAGPILAIKVDGYVGFREGMKPQRAIALSFCLGYFTPIIDMTKRYNKQ